MNNIKKTALVSAAMEDDSLHVLSHTNTNTKGMHTIGLAQFKVGENSTHWFIIWSPNETDMHTLFVKKS
jgi:hypothetical protein